jgi:predicted nucleic acid-binding protein
MDYVIDASVVIEYLTVGPSTVHAQAFFATMTDSDRLLVPEFCLFECTNVIWKQVRFSGMKLSAAYQLLGLLRKIKLQRTPMKRLLDRSLEIAIDYQLARYDAAYVALSERYQCPLVSIDQPQIQAAQREGVTIIPLGSFT